MYKNKNFQRRQSAGRLTRREGSSTITEIFSIWSNTFPNVE